MFPNERIESLRKQNKELLTKLKRQTEELQGLNLLRLACSAGGEKNPETEVPESSVSSAGNRGELLSANRREKDREPLTKRPGQLVNNVSDPVITTVSGKWPHVARDALRKPRTGTKRAEVFAAVSVEVLLKVLLLSGEKPGYCTAEAVTPADHITKPSQHSEDLTHSSLLQDQGNSRIEELRVALGRTQNKPILLPQDREQRSLDRVSFQSPSQELETTSERQSMQPLLGYDWIAGLLDAESSLTERSEQFFSELRSFRQVNKEECVHSQSSGPPVVLADLWSSPAEDDTDQDHTPDTHQCTFCYRINSRLFATPLDPLTACPICKMPKAKHPHTEKDPAFIRISIPRSTLLPAYRYKAHRRNSFDPTDSLGLPSHCLSGWSHSSLKLGSQMSSLDLKSSMVNRSDTVPPGQPEKQLGLSASRVSGSQRSNQLLDVSRLARYRFQHLGPGRTKPHTSSYPVY
ncbi:hypothetical protein NFI96_015104 [Prochilodus magdalenae]|nr:hypothetical protein NFI96_015104 [Prochilodus magdalenae]